MDATPQTLLEYIQANGKNPFRAWLASLSDIQARARIRVRLNRVRLGNFGDVKPVGCGVFELRVSCGPGYRIYLARTGCTIVLLLCGGDKSTHQQDIARAKEYWLDYQQRSS